MTSHPSTTTNTEAPRPPPPNPYDLNKDDNDDDDFERMMRSTESFGSLTRFLPKIPSTPGNIVASVASGLSPNRSSARRFDFEGIGDNENGSNRKVVKSVRGISPRNHDFTGGGSNRLSLVQASVGGVANLVKRMLPRMPSNPPPVDISDEDHAEFERLKAAKWAQRQQQQQGNNGAAPAPPPPPPPLPPGARPPAKAPSANTLEKAAAQEAEFDRMKDEAHARRKEARFIPRPPSSLPPVNTDQANHDEFDRAREAALARRGMMSNSPLARAFSGASFFFSSFSPKREEEIRHNAMSYDPVTGQFVAPEKKPKKPLGERIKHEITERHAIERLLMAGLAICLLWLTSLTVAQSIIYGLLVGPQLDQVIADTKYAFSVTDEQRDLYNLCAERRVQSCNDSFNQDLAAEVANTNYHLSLNRQRLDLYTNLRGNCSDRFGEVVQALDYLQTVKNVPYAPNFTTAVYNSNSSICADVGSILADQIAAINAHVTAEQYKASADAQVLSLNDQIRARQAYDRDYLQNVTQAYLGVGTDMNAFVTDPQGAIANLSTSRDAVVACASKTGEYNGQYCPNLPTMMQKVENVRTNAVNSYADMQSQANANIQDMVAQYKPLYDFYNAFRNAINGISGLVSAVNSAVGQGGGGNEGLSGIGFQNEDPSIEPLPTLSPAASFSSSLGNTNGMQTNLAVKSNNLVASNEGTFAGMQAQADAVKQAQLSWQAQFFSDYNPPPYDPDQADADWNQRSSEFLPAVSSASALISKRVEPALEPDYNTTVNSSDASERAASLLQTPDVRPLGLYAYNMSLDVMLGQWHQITNLALAMDYIYRALRSYSIIRSYSRLSAVMAPPADVRVGVKNAKGVLQPSRKNMDQKIAAIVTHPAVNILLLLMFIGIVSGTFLGVYLPIFDDYVRGCVNGNFRGTGTMLSRNAATIAFSYSANLGDSTTSSAIDRVNVERELVCTANGKSCKAQQTSYLNEYNFDIDRMGTLVSQVSAFRACIDIQKVQDYLGSAEVLIATNQSTSNVTASLYDSSCDSNFAPLDDYEFNCSAIEICYPTCQGPNNDTLQASVFDAACNAEYYAHASIFGTFLSALAFTLMNISRWTFLRGLRRTLWSHFASGDFQYLASANEHGEVEYPEQVTDEGKSMKEAVAEELHATLKRFQRMGYTFIALAALINIPWVALVLRVAENLRYSRSAVPDERL